ncbi:MAG: hypothetical protein COB98_01815 [Flavobacteriaceae bacterium]|nr:MAG: hypothetical protein COB98_01815 [Flavobacteriaceae bacterium]
MKKLLLLSLILLTSLTSRAQDLELLLYAKDDASKLMENYMNPVMEGMLFSLNNGWYHTAKTHKKLGFDITFNVNASIVPSGSKSFVFNQDDYKYLKLANGDKTATMQTIMGDDNDQNIIVSTNIQGKTVKATSFSLPNGITGDLPINAVPSPMVQVGLGLPFKTDLKVRYLPTINTDDVNGSMFGLGIQHDIMQYLGPLDKLPLNVSILAAFTNMNIDYDLQNSSSMAGKNQKASFQMKAYTVQAIASLNFPFIAVYGGVGYDFGNTTLKLKGDYELEYTDATTGITFTDAISDPINLDFNANSFRTTLGARISLGFFKIYADYSIKKYNTISTGIAFSFR